MFYAVIAIIVATLLGVVGYVHNIIDLIVVFTHHMPIDTMVVGRILGLFIPIIGAVLGWF